MQAFLLFLPVQETINNEIADQQNAGRHHHGQEHMHRRPEEGDPFQETQKQRRVPQGRQRSTDIGNQKDKENNSMDLVFAVFICPDQRADQQHRRPGCPHDAGDECANQQDPHIHNRGPLQVPFYPNATRNGKQG